MDQIRRKIVFASPALPLIGLAGCGGGDETSAEQIKSASFAATSSLNSASAVLLIVAPRYKTLDAIFTANGEIAGIGLKPGIVHACLNGTQLFVCMQQTTANFNTRNISLIIDVFSLTPANKRTLSATNARLAGDFVVNNYKTGDHYDYTLGTTGSVSYDKASITSSVDSVTGTRTGTITLSFADLAFNVSGSSLTQTNLAAAPLLLRGSITVPFVEETPILV